MGGLFPDRISDPRLAEKKRPQSYFRSGNGVFLPFPGSEKRPALSGQPVKSDREGDRGQDTDAEAQIIADPEQTVMFHEDHRNPLHNEQSEQMGTEIPESRIVDRDSHSDQENENRKRDHCGDPKQNGSRIFDADRLKRDKGKNASPPQRSESINTEYFIFAFGKHHAKRET